MSDDEVDFEPKDDVDDYNPEEEDDYVSSVFRQSRHCCYYFWHYITVNQIIRRV
jgi:hypothetical protein